MNIAVTVISALLVFGFLIFIHEFGHYITARLFHVSISEFSIGMGPRLLWYDSRKTGIRYSLSVLPIGGYVAMVGEDATAEEAVNDPNSFDKKPAWQRFIITAAGATVNIVFGFLAMILLTSLIRVGDTTVREFVPTEESGFTVSSADSGLMLGDRIVAVEGKRVRIADELSYEIMRYGDEPVDLTVVRDGQQLLLCDVVFPVLEEQGQRFGSMDFKVSAQKKSFGTVMSYSWHKSCLIVRMCWESLFDLITGRYTFAAISGPVGISSAIGTAAQAGFTSLLYIVVLISINLGVMNLLPIPALDGGRLLTTLIEMITRRRMPAKLEATVNAIGLCLLLALTAVVMVKDVWQLIPHG